MSLQPLTLKLDGITAGDYLTWCRDPDPPALDYGLRSIRVDGDPLGDTITAILDWNQPEPAPRAAASASGLLLPTSVQYTPSWPLTGQRHTGPAPRGPTRKSSLASATRPMTPRQLERSIGPNTNRRTRRRSRR
jgi:hypothetical protein